MEIFKKYSKSDLTQQQVWIFAAMLFVFGFAVTFFFQAPLKTIFVYSDELFYYQIARSIAEYGEILVRDAAIGYQKILYPLFISPAFLLSANPVIQVKIISGINCFLMASTVFPTVLLARKLSLSNTAIMLSLFSVVTLPNIAFSGTFMTEVLYLPISVWFFYFFSCAISEFQQLKCNIYYFLLGFLGYLAYLTKEIAVAYIIAVVVIHLIEWILFRKNTKRTIINMSVFMGTFIILLIAIDLTVFKTIDNGYISAGIVKPISTLYSLYYLLYSFVILCLGAVTAFYFFPIAFPLLNFKLFNITAKKTYILSALSLVLALGIIAFTISVREDLGAVVPRLHFRYVMPLIIPFLCLMSECLFNSKGFAKKPNCFYVVGIAVYCATLLLCLPINHSGIVDNFFFRGGPILSGGLNQVAVGAQFLAVKILIIIAIVVVMMFAVKGNKKPIIIISVAIVLSMNIFLSIKTFADLRTNYGVSESDVNAMLEIRDAISQVDGTIVIIAGKIIGTHFTRLVDTYLSSNVKVITYDYLKSIADEDTVNLANDADPFRYSPVSAPYDLSEIDYFICESQNILTNVEVLYSNQLASVVRNLDSNHVVLSDYLPIYINDFNFPMKDSANSEHASNGQAGALMFGPLSALSAGRYKLTMETKLISTEIDQIGYADTVYDNEQITIDQMELSTDMFDSNENMSITFIFDTNDFEKDNGIENWQARIFVNPNVYLEVTDVSLQVLDDEGIDD